MEIESRITKRLDELYCTTKEQLKALRVIVRQVMSAKPVTSPVFERNQSAATNKANQTLDNLLARPKSMFEYKLVDEIGKNCIEVLLAMQAELQNRIEQTNSVAPEVKETINKVRKMIDAAIADKPIGEQTMQRIAKKK